MNILHQKTFACWTVSVNAPSEDTNLLTLVFFKTVNKNTHVVVPQLDIAIMKSTDKQRLTKERCEPWTDIKARKLESPRHSCSNTVSILGSEFHVRWLRQDRRRNWNEVQGGGDWLSSRKVGGENSEKEVRREHVIAVNLRFHTAG
jgi:hypothetical protein